MAGEQLDPVQSTLLENDDGQCEFCTPGLVLAGRELLDANPEPTDQKIRLALLGNLCRGNPYGRIIQSVRTASVHA